MPIPGTVALSGIVAPSSTADTYPVTNPEYGLGGFRTVLTTTQRDAIPDQRRQEGMLVYVMSDQKIYLLTAGKTNSDWVELQGLLVIDGGTY